MKLISSNYMNKNMYFSFIIYKQYNKMIKNLERGGKFLKAANLQNTLYEFEEIPSVENFENYQNKTNWTLKTNNVLEKIRIRCLAVSNH